MTQLVTRIDDELAALIDQLIAEGAVESRSDAVRRGLHTLIDQYRRSQTAQAIVSGYLALPQSDDEGGWTDAAAIAMIEEEPW